jgi:hypothetical protein
VASITDENLEAYWLIFHYIILSNTKKNIVLTFKYLPCTSPTCLLIILRWHLRFQHKLCSHIFDNSTHVESYNNIFVIATSIMFGILYTINVKHESINLSTLFSRRQPTNRRKNGTHVKATKN